MSQENEIEAKKLTPTTDFLPSDGASCSDVWEYSQYRASLRRNGVTFALMTRDGKNPLDPEEQTILLAALNRPNEKSPDAGATE